MHPAPTLCWPSSFALMAQAECFAGSPQPIGAHKGRTGRAGRQRQRRNSQAPSAVAVLLAVPPARPRAIAAAARGKLVGGAGVPAGRVGGGWGQGWSFISLETGWVMAGASRGQCMCLAGQASSHRSATTSRLTCRLDIAGAGPRRKRRRERGLPGTRPGDRTGGRPWCPVARERREGDLHRASAG